MNNGTSSMKQFLLSLLATTVSIALTFGTAAIIDYNKEQKEKREIVMMVIYDMHNTLEIIEKADSNIRQSMNYQKQIAMDTSLFNSLRYQFILLLPSINYTETIERIFSSNIETINTVDNMLFTENVAEFYQGRKLYKTMLSDSLFNEYTRHSPHMSLKALLDFNYSIDVMVSHEILVGMQHHFEQCKQMMEVSDEEIEAYCKERMALNKTTDENSPTLESNRMSVLQLQKEIDEARDKLNLE